MYVLGLLLQEQVAAGPDVLQGIAAALPLAALVVSFIGGVGGLVSGALSLWFTERMKARYQLDIERRPTIYATLNA